MGLIDRLSQWLHVPPPGLYRCVDCGSRYEADQTVCPACGGEIETTELAADLAYYWGPM